MRSPKFGVGILIVLCSELAYNIIQNTYNVAYSLDFVCNDTWLHGAMMTSSPPNDSDVTAGDEPITSTNVTTTWTPRHDDDRLYLHPHWLRYRDVIDSAPDWFIYALGVYITIVGIISISGNATVIAVFSR